MDQYLSNPQRQFCIHRYHWQLWHIHRKFHQARFRMSRYLYLSVTHKMSTGHYRILHGIVTFIRFQGQNPDDLNVNDLKWPCWPHSMTSKLILVKTRCQIEIQKIQTWSDSQQPSAFCETFDSSIIKVHVRPALIYWRHVLTTHLRILDVTITCWFSDTVSTGCVSITCIRNCAKIVADSDNSLKRSFNNLRLESWIPVFDWAKWFRNFRWLAARHYLDLLPCAHLIKNWRFF